MTNDTRDRHQGAIVKDDAGIRRLFEDYCNNILGVAHMVEVSGEWNKMQRDVAKVSEEERDALGNPIGLEEIEAAIKSLGCNKSPGPDGLSGEFYQAFSTYLAPTLQQVYLESDNEVMLPRPFRKTHIILIPKQISDGKFAQVTDYRPITLSNVGYKIYAKVLAERLQKVITFLVGEHQTCGIRGRNIQTNIHVIRTVLDVCTQEGDQAAVVQIGLSKAFDRVTMHSSFLYYRP